MSKKTFNGRKLNKILMGVFVFLCASMNVFAKCSDYSKMPTVVGPSTSEKNACTSATENGYKCTYELTDRNGILGATGLKCYKSEAKAEKITTVQSLHSLIVSDSMNNSTVYGSFTSPKDGATYYANVPKGTKKIRIYGNVSDNSNNNFQMSGVGQKELTSNSTKFTVTFTVGGKTSTYYIVVVRPASGTQQDVPSEEQKCKNNGDYWNTDTSKANKGCYKLNEANCSILGLCGKNSKCDSYCNSNVKVLFDQNYGYGLSCDAGFTVPTAGVCEKSDIAKGTTVNFPASSSSMYRTEGQLIGWTKTVSNGVPNCNSDVIVKDNSFVVNANTDFYACYREDIGGYRYVQDGYLADGGSVDWSCGQAMWIEYCTKENGTDYCYYYENSTKTYRKVYRMKLASTVEGAACKQAETTVNEEDKGYRYVTLNGQNYSCGDQLYITTCTDDACNYAKIKTSSKEISENGTIDRDYLVNSESAAKKACDKLEDSKCNNTKMPNMRKSSNYTICYDEDATTSEIKSNLAKYYTCDTDDGYYFDTTAIVAVGNESCSGNTCKRTYRVSCTKGDKAKPTLSVTSGIVQSNGYGTIQVEAYAKEGEIVSYFASDYYLAPTSSNTWVSVNSSKFTIEASPGVKYIWVKDSNGNISNAVTGAVIDTINNNTTINKLELYDANGNIQNPTSTGTAYKVADVKNNNYVRLSNDLSKDSKVIADAFNPYDMEYKLEVNSPTVSVYATLTSTDSKYVEGFEPRTVNLTYGVNTILIKIQNNEGKIRTYTILVTRTDDRTSDNTLSDITLSTGDINFNANVTDYKVEIPKSTISVDVNSTIASDKASYVSGYEPESVLITGDTTIKLIKVKSETGSTRTYVLTFVKEGTDEITKESLQLEDLVIPSVYIPFEEDVANYSLSVGYETDVIDLNTTLKDENSIASISIKKKNDTEYKVVSSKGIGLDVGENFIEIRVIDNENEESYYRLTVIRKEFGLDISNDTTLKDLKVLDYDINFEPSKKEYTVKIKQEKSLVITAVPNSNRAEVFIRGNDELTGFSTVRVKVVAENGEFETYSIDIKKDAFNKTIEIASIIAGVVIILVSSGIIIVKKKAKSNREYFEE